MRRILLNIHYIFELSVKWTGVVFSIIGLASTFVSLGDLINPNISQIKRLFISIGMLIGVWLIAFVLCAIYVYRKKRVAVLELNGNHHVYVQYGDVFSESEIVEPNKRRNIVIPVNRCFDTQVDNDLISSATLHGITIKKLLDNGFTEDSLANEIQNYLSSHDFHYDELNTRQKRKGNLKRFPVGTTVEINQSDKCTFFLLGLTEFDKDLSASVTREDYAYAIVKLIEFCNKRSQQYPVVMPLIGGGLSRTGREEKAILDFLVATFKMNKDLIDFDLHIIVKDSGKKRIPIADL